MTKLEHILELPFEEYMRECWQHAKDRAAVSPLAAIVYKDMLTAHRADTEAMWARRYWFNKNGAYEA